MVALSQCGGTKEEAEKSEEGTRPQKSQRWLSRKAALPTDLPTSPHTYTHVHTYFAALSTSRLHRPLSSILHSPLKELNQRPPNPLPSRDPFWSPEPLTLSSLTC